jgi:putative two-component system response regulator
MMVDTIFRPTETTEELPTTEQVFSCVLIIDDTPMIVSALSRMLLPRYQVKVALNGEEGINLAERYEIDIILLDLNMPGLSGFEVLGRLRNSQKTLDIPVVLITADDDVENKELAFSLGAVDYIKKPFSEDIVNNCVRRHIRNLGGEWVKE